MALILNIDTALETASLCLAKNGEEIKEVINPEQRDHAAWIHTTIRQLMKDCGITLNQLDAIAISAGPGSYTGLRVGMSTAKGLCYALEKPLITISTLQIMAKAALSKIAKDLQEVLLAPMIDARRMEVYTAIFNKHLQTIKEPSAVILDETSFIDILGNHPVIFFGNGSAKFQPLINHFNATFLISNHSAKNMVEFAEKKFNNSDFADLAYSEPLYVKAFYSPQNK
ncbi:MAG TPA: tRNA (adenosine(37)-N6)-threonylcarbamoyltransferase complex dimerization subunit type 1 TsaB [Chitinophagaceae bacterium]|jgi:universal bacterial protein YeaZ